jgi:uncharacterized protein YlxP (DUF503 family)
VKVLIWRARCRILSSPQSLKEKRSVVQPVLAKARNKFHLSAAEVGEHDMLNVAEFGFCSVGVDATKLEQIAERCRDGLERDFPIEFFDEDVSVESY